MTEKLYHEVDARKLGKHYTKHVLAMTAEALYEKSAIAEQLGYRDQQLETLTVERDEAREWVRRITSEQNTLTCVYCGHAYPPGAPTHGAEVLTAHIEQCEKHPMHAVKASAAAAEGALDQLRSWLEDRSNRDEFSAGERAAYKRSVQKLDLLRLANTNEQRFKPPMAEVTREHRLAAAHARYPNVGTIAEDSWAHQWAEGRFTGFGADEDSLNAIAQAIADAEQRGRATQSKAEWIPCDERLPEPERDVLLYYAVNGMMLRADTIVARSCVRQDGSRYWYSAAFPLRDGDEIAWMPRPAPPETAK
jgi:hypothetical protein